MFDRFIYPPRHSGQFPLYPFMYGARYREHTKKIKETRYQKKITNIDIRILKNKTFKIRFERVVPTQEP